MEGPYDRWQAGPRVAPRQHRPTVFLWMVAAVLSLLAASGVVSGDDCDNFVLEYGYECVLGASGASGSQNANLTIWCPWDSNPTYMRAFINATRKIARNAQGVQFVIKVKSWAGPNDSSKNYISELGKALRSDAPVDDLTLFVVGTTWLSHFINSEVLLSLTDRAAEWEYLNSKGSYDPLASVSDLWSRNPVVPNAPRQWYAVPIATDTSVLVYNKHAFAAAKLRPPPAQIKSWADLFAMAKAVNNSLPGKWGFGIREDFEFSTRILAPYLFDTTRSGLIMPRGSSWQCGLNTPLKIQALRNFTNMWADNVAAPVVACGDPAPNDLGFDDVAKSEGGVAILILAPNKLDLNMSSENIGFAALPKSFIGGVAMAINQKVASSPRENYAWEIIKELVEGHLNDIAKDTFSPPPIYNRSTSANYAPWNISGTMYAAANSGVRDGIDILHPNTDQPFSYGMESKFLFRCMLDQILNKKDTVEDAARDFCTKLNKVIKDYCRVGDDACENKKGGKSSVVLVVGLTLGAALLAAVVAAIAIFVLKQRKENEGPMRPTRSFRSLRLDPGKMSKKELMVATDNFNPDNLLGKGGFGTVYKGVLPNGKMVAVKQLIKSSEGEEEFLNEIEIISKIHHRNLVSVEGFCLDKRRNIMLVYNLMPNGSLEDALFKTDMVLTWPQAFGIILGTANGINYLHTGCEQKIIHRDIKPANILLDEHLVARVSDFGMAKNTNVENTHVSTRIMGTLGYLDPNYSVSGQLTDKSDVYSFGIVMLVMLLRKRPFDVQHVTGKNTSQVTLVDYVQIVPEKAIERVISRFSNANDEEVTRCIHVTVLCVQVLPEARPTMAQALQMLTGDLLIPRLPHKEFVEDAYIPNYSGGSSRLTMDRASREGHSEGGASQGSTISEFTSSHYDVSMITKGR